MMLFLLLPVFATAVLGIDIITLEPGKIANLTQGDYIIQSPNFPNQYGFYDKKGQIILAQPAEVGAGYYLFFKEFMLSDHEYMTISHDFTSETLKGSVFPNRGSAAYIYTKSGIVFTVQSDGVEDGLAHTGFQINVQYHGADEVVGTTYENTTDLDTMDHAYFFVSPAYPVTDGSNPGRTQTFISKNNIRVLLYDFNFHGKVTLSGTTANGTEVIPYTGFETIISTAANYFVNEVTIDVVCSLLTGCGRYFIIVEPYTPTPTTFTAENITLLSNMLRNFQSYDGTLLQAYPNNLNYYLNITAPEFVNQKIMLYIELESEASSDVMALSGLTVNPAADDWRLTGSWHTIIFPETNHLQLTFTSDGVGQAAGFRGSLFMQSCNCPDSMVLKDAYQITNPGLVGRSYCPGLNCEWNYKFAVNKILELNMESLLFRNLDYLRILDHQNKTIVVVSNSNKPESSFYVDSGIVYFHFITSTELEVPPVDVLQFTINANIIDIKDLADNNIYNSVLDEVTFMQDKNFRKGASVGYLNTFTIQPPFTVYDLSTLPNGLLSAYNNGSSYSAISPDVRYGIATYTSDVSSMAVQYYNPEFTEGNIIKLLSGPSNMFSRTECLLPPVVNIAFGASFKLNLEAKNTDCKVFLYHNITDIEQSALMFTLIDLHNNSDVEIFMGTGSFKLDNVPVYVYGDVVTIQYSGSPGSITVNSVIPSTTIKVGDNCTPTYITTPSFKNDLTTSIYTYEFSAITASDSWTYHFTPLTDLEQILTVTVWTGPQSKVIRYSDIKAGSVQKFVGTRLTFKVEYAGNPVGLYFSIAACKDAVDDHTGAAINVGYPVSVMFITILVTIYNNYKSLM
uniref:CUB_2 domain-containing protein n=1 Tax=Panagrellus redivivus TaxID=6233 RepID=A0A7E4UWJ9_PANRE